MNAEALIGTTLGNCTLQQLVGRGALGVVYLAHQSDPHRQVVVKVFLPLTILQPQQHATFLERFRREAAIVASLKHPNILPVYDCGEQDGVAYQVMPYISGGTLQDVMKREGALPLSQVLEYLDQLADALDYAHQQGIIHRDIKPANILLNAQGRLLLTDFGLVKLMKEVQGGQGQSVQKRLTAGGASMGTPDYIAPEQILGGKIDGRADIYSLGVILYQMVTGRLPFFGKTALQVAVKHLHTPPGSPRLRRPDLPLATEQVMLRALAKRPEDRYMRAQDLAAAFRLTLTVAEVQLDDYQKDLVSVGAVSTADFNSSKPSSGFSSPGSTMQANKIDIPESRALVEVLQAAMEMDEPTANIVQTPVEIFLNMPTGNPQTPVPAVAFPPMREAAIPSAPFSLAADSVEAVDKPELASPELNSRLPVLASNTTGMLNLPNYVQGDTGTIKLTEPVKVVQVPVAGQPGLYFTGLLPVYLQSRPLQSMEKPHPNPRKVLALAMVILLIVLASATFWFMRADSGVTTERRSTVHSVPNLQATATATALARLRANIILLDPLSQNIHNWPVATSGSKLYVFEDGAYHITDNDNMEGAPAILPDEVITGPFVYTLTMEEIKGDDSSNVNSFGMILRSNIVDKNGRIITTFYTFEVLNRNGGEYQFWKYDDSHAPSAKPWAELWHHSFGREFHEGHGPGGINTFRIIVNGKKFTLIVNGKQVGTVQDGSFASGGIGMLVNLKGTEVAFSNLQLTHTS